MLFVELIEKKVISYITYHITIDNKKLLKYFIIYQSNRIIQIIKYILLE